MVMKCIDQILLEWALESDDGLLSGYNSSKNISCLKIILNRKNISAHLCEEIISEILAVEAQPLEPKKPRKLSARQISNAERDAAEKARVSNINPNEASVESLTDLKEIREKVPEIMALANQYPELKANYNKLSVDGAIEFVNNPANASFVRPMSELKGSTLGEGELILVFLIKDAISGGTKSGDIEVGGQKIDVKKLDSWKFRVELASFAGFSSTEFNAAISELIHFAVDKKNAEVLKKLTDAADDKILSNSAAKAKKFKETTKKFFDSPDVELLRKGAVMGLLGIAAHLTTADQGKPATDYADFVIDQDKTTVNVDNSKEIEKTIKQQSIKGLEAQPQNVNVKVSPIDDEESQLIMPKIKRLTYFVDRFGPSNIAKNVLPKLHYDSIIFYDPINKNGNGKLYHHMTKEDVSNGFEFYGWAKAPVFLLSDRPDGAIVDSELENIPT